YGFSNTERTGVFVRDREDNLARERALLGALGNPHQAYGITHVAGTKGKGSTSALLAAILWASGLRTGLYTSPDLHTFRERMRVDGELIAPGEVTRLVPQIRAALEQVDSSLGPYITWEVATALTFLFFREAGVQHAVVEVGLGGRLDATNVVNPLVSVITSISYDHMAVLGNTLAEIAREKAGIIKPGVPVVTSAQAPEALDVIARIASERGAPLIRVGPAGTPGADYTYRAGPFDTERQTLDVVTPSGTLAGLELALLGEHQLENAAAAIAAAETLRARGLPISEGAVREGLRAARWPARLQVVAQRPWIVVDGAHNADSFARMLAALRRHFPFRRLLLVLGLMADKDVPGITREIAGARVSQVFATSWHHPRATTGESIAAQLAEVAPELPVRTFLALDSALAAALAEAHPDDLICACGSVAFAGEALRWLAGHVPESAPRIEIAGVDH
ncbi:MAG TPA: folylpolyglutamate synthase/dihydrofolate synthase family protein, partial [Ktedonobacterales bacterium]|nr:folylpolyglutamate synthase/dihydrofolate synthase family protein [Ktedonobacterales bacterium]